MGGDTPTAPAAEPTVEGALQLISEAFKRWDLKATEEQKGCRRLAWFAAVLGPLAVLLLTVQVVFARPETHVGWAAVLIGGELLCLGFILLRGYLALKPHAHEWVVARLRAEVLRREEFLLYAKVGPYLAKNAPNDVHTAADVRVRVIEAAMPNPPDLICLCDSPGHVMWRDQLEDAGPGAGADPLPDWLPHYQTSRVHDQEQWFRKKSAAWLTNDGRWENVARGALLLALILAAMHLAIILLEPSLGAAASSIVHRAVVVAAIALLPVGMAMTGLQSIYEGRRLSRSYADQAARLRQLDIAFTQLAGQGSAEPALKLRLKRLVLQTEEVTASELRQWWLIMSP